MNSDARSYWRGIHLGVNRDRAIDRLVEEIPLLADMGLNVLVPEVNYQFTFQSHPELRGKDPITLSKVKQLVAACRAHSIRLIPQFQCLGHQSWAENTFSLLQAYPEFDETPGQFPNNESIYCRSWCPQHPEVNPIVFELFDELLDAFEADALHVGLDEVFLIGSEHCPRCRGHDPAELFAKAVNDYYGYLAGERHVEMLMWGDRLLDGVATGYGLWEASENGTDSAIDLIPKDIVICDWHYELMAGYPSIPIFLEKGFPTWPGGWKDEDAAKALLTEALKQTDDPNMLGYLCTTWGHVHPGELAAFPPIRIAMEAMS